MRPDDSKKPANAAGCAREATMNLHAPSQWIFLLSVLIAVFAIISTFTPIQYVSTYAFWFAIIAFIVLAFGNVVRT
jgi:hypothetical protein